ncbi:jg15828 [Pararge aegeria aegeria]|uniref:Jg15828 protein n=1 Tax=Pararge aegeria aegeria TaxID=348720 RepID=A0A8S4SNM8_9NEOP|nr:jg15828 [Pararge aegeria aegeria]
MTIYLGLNKSKKTFSNYEMKYTTFSEYFFGSRKTVLYSSFSFQAPRRYRRVSGDRATVLDEYRFPTITMFTTFNVEQSSPGPWCHIDRLRSIVTPLSRSTQQALVAARNSSTFLTGRSLASSGCIIYFPKRVLRLCISAGQEQIKCSGVSAASLQSLQRSVSCSLRLNMCLLSPQCPVIARTRMHRFFLLSANASDAALLLDGFISTREWFLPGSCLQRIRAW